jgi:hypothetical protein
MYDLTAGKKDSKVHYFSANPNGEAEVIRAYLRPEPKLKKTIIDYDFKDLTIKGRNSKGNIFSKRPIKKIIVKEDGVSTLGAIDIWFDDTVKRLNTEERGNYIGAFKSDDKILSITKSGHYQLHGYDLTTHFDDDMIHIEKYDSRKPVTAIYIESTSKLPYVKRFFIEETDKKVNFVGDENGKLLEFSLDYLSQLELTLKKGKDTSTEVIDMDEFIGIKSYKAKGKRLTNEKIKSLNWAEPLDYEYPPLEDEDQEESEENEEKVTEASEHSAADPKQKAQKAEEVEAEEVEAEEVEAEEPEKSQSQIEEDSKIKKADLKENPIAVKSPQTVYKEVKKPVDQASVEEKKAEDSKETRPAKEEEKPTRKAAKIPPMKKSEEAKKKMLSEDDNVEFEIEMDDDHIIVEKKDEPKENKGKSQKKKPPSSEGQITLDFE